MYIFGGAFFDPVMNMHINALILSVCAYLIGCIQCVLCTIHTGGS